MTVFDLAPALIIALALVALVAVAADAMGRASRVDRLSGVRRGSLGRWAAQGPVAWVAVLSIVTGLVLLGLP